jgi:molybdate transport system substrate-binding protein
MTRLALVGVAIGCLGGASASAAEIEVFSAGAVAPGLARLIETFRRETGHQVRLTVAVPAVLRQRVEAGETPDVLIAPPAVVEPLVQAGKIVADTPPAVGRVGVGVTVRQDAPAPDVSSAAALRDALLAADRLVYNRASTGTYFERVVTRLGIGEQVAAKTVRYPDGTSVLEHVAKGTGREIGIGAISEIREYEAKGLRLVGPLPAELQNYTTYVAGVLTGSRSPEAARALVRFVTSPPAKAAFAATGVE